MKIKTSKKKFYNKYDYKITLNIDGCECLRYHSISDSKKFLENKIFPRYYLSETRKIKISENRKTLIDFCETLLEYEAGKWKKRIEANNIDIFTESYDLINDLKQKFIENVSSIYKPANNIEPFTLQVKKFPDDRYKYRVFLLPHKLKNNEHEKEKYLTWIKSQQNKIKISYSVEQWFMRTVWNWDPRYILVDEESTLLMLKLRNPEIVGRVYKFKII